MLICMFTLLWLISYIVLTVEWCWCCCWCWADQRIHRRLGLSILFDSEAQSLHWTSRVRSHSDAQTLKRLDKDTAQIRPIITAWWDPWYLCLDWCEVEEIAEKLEELNGEMTEVLYEYDYDDMLQIDLDNFYQFEHLFNDTEGINVSRITNQGVENLSSIQKVWD